VSDLGKWFWLLSLLLSKSVYADAPVAVVDSYAVAENAVLNAAAPGVLNNDIDADGDAIHVAEVQGSAGSVGTQLTLASGATLTLNANGSFS
ncbi:uncharacterized protein METZ01_LOCUS255091, partial [marine metagenome]